MKDGFGREIDYMRVSVTERCNLNCVYCRPNGGTCSDTDALSTEDILRIVSAAATIGIKHIRLTGGEPLVRKDIAALTERIGKVQGIESVSLTTNGVLLGKLAASLFRSGIRCVNVSLDTVDTEAWKRLTGADCLSSVVEGIQKARTCGMQVKLNAVVYPNTDAVALAEFAEREGCVLRFIEMMPIGSGAGFRSVSLTGIRDTLRERYGESTEKVGMTGHGPATYLKYAGRTKPIGFIEAIHDRFCANCNRVRLTASGDLKLCLCYSDGISLVPLLREGADTERLAASMREAIQNKPAAHCFETPCNITETRNMSSIGG